MSFLRMRRRQFIQRSSFFLMGAGLSACGFAGGSASQNAESTPAATAASPTTAATGTLNLYTWADYVNPEVAQAFTQETGVKITADTYDANETMLAKVQAGGGTGYSLVYPSDYMVAQMVELNLLEPLDQSRLEAVYGDLGDNFKNLYYDPENKYSIPYTWGTTGIAYNSKELKKAPTDFNSLWEMRDQIKGRLTLLDDVREVMGMSLKSLGYSLNSKDKAQLQEAYDKLRELKPAVATFTSYDWRDRMISGDIVVSHAYSGDGLQVGKENPDVKYVVPASGCTLWNDTIAMLKTAPNKDAAYEWIKYSMEPKNSAVITEAILFGNPLKAVPALLPESIKSNPGWAVAPDLLAKTEKIEPLDDTTQAIYDDYWTKLKSV
ncbi:PotD/PotF family extracellular solute-binding protein [Leptolyngbya sp. FACHB-261]|uniref:ABC transporter substrate-binding protein n=1 Tax=Leptolyngbya sp. FACHB-261 TaxID=2692806 RepID=UPI0016893D11|nr:spermidine/putrescine ABC transporter substrate-binding protein [Leptolyngbya sp. FACHB-261]MBD2100539.1 spermidine/putrescine ABC transporter substrate-binding protein [Leptolyngbya sp. FACHB-261]